MRHRSQTETPQPVSLISGSLVALSGGALIDRETARCQERSSSDRRATSDQCGRYAECQIHRPGDPRRRAQPTSRLRAAHVSDTALRTVRASHARVTAGSRGHVHSDARETGYRTTRPWGHALTRETKPARLRPACGAGQAAAGVEHSRGGGSPPRPSSVQRTGRSGIDVRVQHPNLSSVPLAQRSARSIAAMDAAGLSAARGKAILRRRLSPVAERARGEGRWLVVVRWSGAACLQTGCSAPGAVTWLGLIRTGSSGWGESAARPFSRCWWWLAISAGRRAGWCVSGCGIVVCGRARLLAASKIGVWDAGG